MIVKSENMDMIRTPFIFYFFRVFFLSPAASAADLDREVVSMAHLLAKFRIEVIKSMGLRGKIGGYSIVIVKGPTR